MSIESATAAANRRLRDGHRPGPMKSLGYRLVAFSCHHCHDLITNALDRVLTTRDPAPHGWCRRCREQYDRTRFRDRSKTTYTKPRRVQRAHTERGRMRYQCESIDAAYNAGKEWTGPELEIVARADLTSREAARLLGRSYAAVRVQRSRLRQEPYRTRLLVGAGDLT